MSGASNVYPIALPASKRKHSELQWTEDDLESIIKSGCGCKENCLKNLCEGPYNYSRGIQIINKCRTEILPLSQTELKAYIKGKILSLNKSTFENGRSFYQYSIIYQNIEFLLCHNAFRLCYGISEYVLKEAKKCIKYDLHSTTGKFSDSTKVHVESVKLLDSALKKSSINDLERKTMIGLCQLHGSDEILQV